MSHTITSQCIGCGSCQDVCPTGAIELHGFRYRINANLCHDCFDSNRVPYCIAARATQIDCIVKSLTGREYWRNWLLKCYRLLSCLRPNPPKSKLLRAKAYKLLSTKFLIN
jgi:ferredoxin